MQFLGSRLGKAVFERLAKHLPIFFFILRLGCNIAFAHGSSKKADHVLGRQVSHIGGSGWLHGADVIGQREAATIRAGHLLAQHGQPHWTGVMRNAATPFGGQHANIIALAPSGQQRKSGSALPVAPRAEQTAGLVHESLRLGSPAALFGRKAAQPRRTAGRAIVHARRRGETRRYAPCEKEVVPIYVGH